MGLLNPTSVAVIGASAQEGKVGHDVLKNLVTQGFAGEVFPINPKGGEILGKTVYASVKDTPVVPDVAVIVIPAKLVMDALKECGEKGVKNVVVISAGFGEVHTEEGKALEAELVTIARKYGITLIGPNCLGYVRPHFKLNASFATSIPPSGGIAFISQSGAMGVALMDGAKAFGLGFSAFVSIGNKAVTDEGDMLQMFADDPDTKVIGLYLESIKDGRRFLETASNIAERKPIVLLKAGVSEHGRQAASSHTGALAGSDTAIDALCAQTGIRRARSTEEFYDLLSILSFEPTLPSNRIAIVTNAGGPGILATDAAEALKLQMPRLSAMVEEELRTKLPATASTANPIDVIGDSGADRYEAAIHACRKDPNIDGIVLLLTPQVMTPVEEIARTAAHLMSQSPLMPVAAAFMGGESAAEGRAILRAAGIPTFDTPERAVRAIAALRLNATHHALSAMEKAPMHNTQPVAHGAAAQELLAHASGLLDEDTTQKLFALYDLPMPKAALAHTAEEAVRIAEEIGYPVIAKISSPQILHKTDIGGVKANLKNAAEVTIAYRHIMEAAKERTSGTDTKGILIQQFLPVGNEFIVGTVRDASFGPLVMVGLGGIYTELFRDTAFRIAPIDVEGAYQMLAQLKSWQLLLGMRGNAQSDIDGLASVIAKISRLVTDCPQIKELDLNPVLVGTSGIAIADVKVVAE